MPRTRVHCAEQRQETGPCSIALIDSVGITLEVCSELLEQPMHRVILNVERAARHEIAVFGVQQEYHPQQHRQQADVDLIGGVFDRLFEEFAIGLFVGCLEASKQLVQRVQNLT